MSHHSPFHLTTGRPILLAASMPVVPLSIAIKAYVEGYKKTPESQEEVALIHQLACTALKIDSSMK
jgi:hypothetical protein